MDRLLAGVFTEHTAKVGSMVREFAYVYTRSNLRFCLGAFAGKRLVAHAAARTAELVIRGARVRWAAYGNVATHPDFRGQGIAGRIGALMYRRLRAAGVHLVYISGTRSLYTRAGAVECGSSRTFTIRAGRIPAAGRGLAVRPAHGADLTALARMTAAEPVHFADTAADFRTVLRTGWVQCERAGAWVVTFRGRPVTGAITGRKERGGGGFVAHYAGLRLALGAGLPAIARRAGIRRLAVNVPGWDVELADLLTATVGRGSPAGLQSTGTLLLLDAPRMLRLAGLRAPRPRTTAAVAALTRRLFGTPGCAAGLPLPPVGLHYM